jgi:hypothetical protein
MVDNSAKEGHAGGREGLGEGHQLSASSSTRGNGIIRNNPHTEPPNPVSLWCLTTLVDWKLTPYRVRVLTSVCCGENIGRPRSSQETLLFA